MAAQAILITVDDRVRLISAALAATSWPEREQTAQRFRAHAHARATARQMAPWRDHPAVRTLDALLSQGVLLRDIYTLVFALAGSDPADGAWPDWLPPGWLDDLRDLQEAAALHAWWDEHHPAWTLACEQATQALDGIHLAAFFEPFFGPSIPSPALMPNICYPCLIPLGISAAHAAIALVPPRIAWGDGEPWPFHEDRAYLLRAAVTAFGQVLLESHLAGHRSNGAESDPDGPAAPPVEAFLSGAVALALEQILGAAEARAYLLVEARTNGARVLPRVVEALKDYLAAHAAGQYPHFASYLPVFAAHVRAGQERFSHT